MFYSHQSKPKKFDAWNKTFEQFLTGYELVTLNRFYSCTQKNHFGMKQMICSYWNFVRNDEEQTWKDISQKLKYLQLATKQLIIEYKTF